MKHRGRKSAAELALVPLGLPEPPPPPPELSEDEAGLWLDIVRSRPNQFDAGLEPLLTAYIHHISAARQLHTMLQETPTTDRLFGKLLAMHARETAAMVRLAARLKLLPAKREEPTPWPRPWEICP